MRDEDKTKRQLVAELAALREQTAEPFRYLLEHVADACFIMARDGSFIDVNQRACDSLGYTREELLSSSGQDVDVDWDSARIAGCLSVAG